LQFGGKFADIFAVFFNRQRGGLTRFIDYSSVPESSRKSKKERKTSSKKVTKMSVNKMSFWTAEATFLFLAINQSLWKRFWFQSLEDDMSPFVQWSLNILESTLCTLFDCHAVMVFSG
jgi:L-lactate permease